MKNQDKKMLFTESKDLISKKTADLNNELGKINFSITQEENKIIFDNCDNIISDLNKELLKIRKFN